MNALPVRLFHASLTGIVIGTICSLAVLQLEQDLFASPTDGTTSGTGSGESSGEIPPPTDPPVSPDPNDLDGDGIPNVWEIQFHHDPSVAKDAGADFDNDGLTAREEYQLHVRTGGVAGNPLGQWYSETVPVPPEFADGWFYPVDINDNGDILVSGSLVHDGVWQYKSFVITPDDAWTEITPVGGNTGGYLWVSDFNDKGEVVGGRYSEDWSTYESFIWDSGTGYRPFSYMGRRAEPYKINNYGDWIGTVEDPETGEMRPAYVVGGINQHSSDDWWSYLWYSDINDFGEAMGSYYNSLTQHNNTLLAYGSWVFDTGLLGSVPAFDPDTYSWSWSSAMNAYGEFAGTSSGLLENQWSYLGYHFDGEFNEIKFSGADLQYMSPESLNSSNTVVGYAGDGSGIWGAFIYRDGVGMFIQQLISGSGPSYNSKINNHGQIVSTNNTGEIVLITPDQDQDGDGISDDWEDFHGLDKTFSPDAFVDTDNDGTSNLGEFLLRSDPNAVPVLDADGNEIDTRPGIDTDGDGIPNVWEWENGLDYQDAGDASMDFDRDGYTNLQEYRLNTDPRGAPAYRIREIGPFPGTTSVSMSPTTLGNGASSNSFAAFVGDNLTDSVFFAAQPTGSVNGGRRPAAWSISRTEAEGSFALYPSHGTQYTNLVAQSPGGAALAYTSGSPSIFRYWASATVVPISLSGATTSHNIKSLSNARFSPSGNYLVGTRTTQSTNTQELVVWKMPASATQTFIPVKLIPPSGVVISQSATAYVNDHGYIAATATVNGQNRPVLWKVNDTGSAASASTLPVLTGGTWARAIGISNQSAPVIAGTSTIAGGQQRATVWKSNGTTFIPSNLGTLAGGNYSTIVAITPGGLVAGTFNGLVGGTLKSQLFIASFDADSSSWKLQAQGEPGASVSFRSLNDCGEMLGTTNQSSPEYKQIPTLWRFGRAHSLESAIPRSSGYTLDSITAINPYGTLLATTWKDGARTTVLLTPDRDTDGDGLPDAFENQHGFNAFARQTSSTDSDSDALSDLEEFRNGTDPRNADTDSDGMRDGWEVSWGLLPLDPTDAALDPDNDHVTNLRESQVGTTPTGIYKVETRLTDTEWVNPYVTATDDRGRIIHTGQYQDSFDTDEDGFWIETSSKYYSALVPTDSSDAGTPIPLPSYSYWYRYNSDWTQYSYTSEYPSFWPDPDSGSINGAMQRYSQDYDGVEYLSDESYFLIPDAAKHLDPDTWISWETVENKLRPATFDNSYFDDYGDWAENILTTPGVMDGADMLNPYADAVSSSGTRRIHRSNMGECFVLNERGEFMEKLPPSVNWQQINNQGQALALTNRYIPSANGIPAYNAQEFQLVQYGGVSTLAIPHTPGVTTNYSLQRFSDDGKALLTRSVINAQGSNAYENHLFDIHTGSLTRVKQPGLGYESMVSLSNHNSRLLGSGSKPFQITPDGTCIRLEALRIKESSFDAPVPFSTLYSKPISPIHISSDGRITLTTPNPSGQTTILQIVPDNDLNYDGVSDDFAEHVRDALNLSFITAETIINDLGNTLRELYESLLNEPEDDDSNPILMGPFPPEWSYRDDDHDGLTNGKERELQTNPYNPNTDRDSIPDGEDADPRDVVIDWQKTSEPSWFVRDLNVPVSPSTKVSDLSLGGMVLIHTDGGALIIDKNNVQSTVPYYPENPLGAASGYYFRQPTYQLVGERVYVNGLTTGTNVGSGWHLWDPATNAYTKFDDSWFAYPDDILDATAGHLAMKHGRQVPYRGISVSYNGNEIISGCAGIRAFESNENFAGGGKYFTYNPTTLNYDNGRLVSISGLFEPYTGYLGGVTSSATLVQSMPENHRRIRHLVPSMEGLYVANDSLSFRRSKFVQPFLFNDAAATLDGWVIKGMSTDEAQVWANGKWKPMKFAVGQRIPESITPGIVKDNGLCVAKIQYPGEAEKYVILIPAFATELAPRLVDDNDRVIAASSLPNYLLRDAEGSIIHSLDTTNPMVERDPTSPVVANRILDASTRRIAWREIKIKAGKYFAGKTVTWSMTEQFTPSEEFWPGAPHGADYRALRPEPGGPRFRGEWTHAYHNENGQVDYRRSFSPSETYDTHDFEVKTRTNESSPGSATTTVDPDGYSAIRVNLPPIGFNKARISIEIAGVPGNLNILDLEVPAVVVIDPGHGGRENVQGSNANNATARPSGTLERDMTLDYALCLQTRFAQGPATEGGLLRVVLTRQIDNFNPTGSARAIKARDFGADVLFSIHFNASISHTARGSEVLVRGNSNVNETEDSQLGQRVLDAIMGITTIYDPANAHNRGVKNYAWSETLKRDIPSEWAVLSDNSYGNTATYHPIRGVIAEIEFIDIPSGDALLNTGSNAENVRRDLCSAVRDAVVRDIRVQPN